MERLFESFHDAEIVAIETDRHAKSVTLRFVLDDRSIRRVDIADVSHFKATDFIAQNVVSRIEVSTPESIPSQDIHHWIGWVTTLSDGSSFATSQEVSSIAQRVVQGELVLFVVKPSWGTEIAIIGKSYIVS
jgi:hypothetical protein